MLAKEVVRIVDFFVGVRKLISSGPPRSVVIFSAQYAKYCMRSNELSHCLIASF